MPDDLSQNSRDYIVTTARAVLGLVPFAGSLLAELAGTVIPKQRLDRISDFAIRLESKVNDIDQERVRAELQNENFSDLFEETARHAAQAVTDDRREYLASLLASGLHEERISFIESKHLLRILGQINDIEIIWLRFLSHPYMSGDDEFRTKHRIVLEPVSAVFGSDQKTIDQRALHKLLGAFGVAGLARKQATS